MPNKEQSPKKHYSVIWRQILSCKGLVTYELSEGEKYLRIQIYDGKGNIKEDGERVYKLTGENPKTGNKNWVKVLGTYNEPFVVYRLEEIVRKKVFGFRGESKERKVYDYRKVIGYFKSLGATVGEVSRIYKRVWNMEEINGEI